MREPLRDRERLEHIITAADNIARYTEGKAFDDLQADDMMGYAVVYNILAIGEAAYKLTNAFRRTHPETQWNGIMRMRNVLAHDYYKLKLQTVWEVVQHDLPLLREQVARYLAETDWDEWEKNAVVIKETAVHKNLVQTATRMKQRGYDTDEICKITGLPREEIDRL
jgi:uncharacterized protein with HEPN domain